MIRKLLLMMICIGLTCCQPSLQVYPKKIDASPEVEYILNTFRLKAKPASEQSSYDKYDICHK